MVNKIPDSEWLASMVVSAYQDQRYDLGEALARLCGQAVRMERSNGATPVTAVAVVGPLVYEPGHAMCTDCATRHPAGLCPGDTDPFPDIPNDSPGWAPGEYEHRLIGPPDPCQYCGAGIRWSAKLQEWTHINSEGSPVASPLPAHVGRPPGAINESNAQPVQEAPTRVVPSARCRAMVSDAGGISECHEVLYWTEQTGWVHLNQADDHQAEPDRPVQA